MVNDLDVPLARDLSEDARRAAAAYAVDRGLYVPNIDDSLDEEAAKRAFWSAFRVLGQWWADLPPY